MKGNIFLVFLLFMTVIFVFCCEDDNSDDDDDTTTGIDTQLVGGWAWSDAAFSTTETDGIYIESDGNIYDIADDNSDDVYTLEPGISLILTEASNGVFTITEADGSDPESGEYTVTSTTLILTWTEETPPDSEYFVKVTVE